MFVVRLHFAGWFRRTNRSCWKQIPHSPSILTDSLVVAYCIAVVSVVAFGSQTISDRGQSFGPDPNGLK